jgi:sterol desaturase/sphingolipid hydroxylase (fatty acid hydroxylase superfamily)
MDWIIAIEESCLETLAWVLGMAVGFGVLACFMPCNRGMYWWKDWRGAGTDLLYRFIVPIFGRVSQALLLTAAIALAGGPACFAQIAQLPLWLQALAILLLQDVWLYWMHRLFHTRLAWRFHAVHHSPKMLDWIAASRFHLVNVFMSGVLADVVVLLLGFSPAALIALAPFNILYSSLVHANLNWTFGPLRYVLASPVFHRWHHTLEEEAMGKNFASTFPWLDVLFGTFYMPPDKLPQHFGNGEEDFPEDFWGQLLYPFRKTSNKVISTEYAVLSTQGERS